MRISIRHQCPRYDDFRSAKVASLFNCERGDSFEMEAELPLETVSGWRIGLICGPSGSGKTSLGSRIFPGVEIEDLRAGWAEDQPIISAICPEMKMDDVTNALLAVGLGSVPAWLRPFRVLSNGEGFRAGLARALCRQPERMVIDEFTSVIDRTVAKTASMAFSSAWRRGGSGQAVLLSCHYDVAEWLQPDWMFDTATGKFSNCLPPRPKLELHIHRATRSDFRFFEPHHYLKAGGLPPGDAYLGIIAGEVVAFGYVQRPWGMGDYPSRVARIVILPEWQGIGLGWRMACQLAAITPGRVSISTRHPGFVRSLLRHGWELHSQKLHGSYKNSDRRETLAACGSSLRYAGPKIGVPEAPVKEKAKSPGRLESRARAMLSR